MSFDKNFVWGAATASYQIEGAAYEDGKGPNIWDDLCKSGRILNRDSGEVACDHYHRYKEDIALMKECGMNGYRFSISWSRIMPEGKGKINPAGIKFYQNLVDELLKNGITPFVTLYHWDYPSELLKYGGWLNPESPQWFADYTRVVVEALGDKVKHYMTLNEPQVFVGAGYCGGDHAPQICYPIDMRVKIAHNVLKAHGMAVKVIRELVPDSKIGFAPCSTPTIPFSDEKQEVDSARECYFSIGPGENDWVWSLTWWSDPVFLGKYPEGDAFNRLKQYLPENYEEDLKLINQPLDFCGQNIYQGIYVKKGERWAEHLPRKKGYARTAIDWPVTPEVLYWGVKFIYERYGLPVYITENGISCIDAVSLDGKVHDPNRIDFLNRYLLQLRKAAEDGIPVHGYFQWSFMDNFEWTLGYHERFGLIYVDYETQKRIPKDSFYWYKEVIKENGENL